MAERVPLQSIKHGDTWPGMTITIEIDGATPVVALSSVKMQFRKRKNSEGDAELSLASPATITITDADDWSVNIPAQVLDLEVGTWYWDVEFTDLSGVIRTPIEGTLSIDQDVTR